MNGDVWNPVTKKAAWHVATEGEVAGVWNPGTKTVEWQTSTSGSVAGIFVLENPGDYQDYLRLTS